MRELLLTKMIERSVRRRAKEVIERLLEARGIGWRYAATLVKD